MTRYDAIRAEQLAIGRIATDEDLRESIAIMAGRDPVDLARFADIATKSVLTLHGGPFRVATLFDKRTDIARRGLVLMTDWGVKNEGREWVYASPRFLILTRPEIEDIAQGLIPHDWQKRI